MRNDIPVWLYCVLALISMQVRCASRSRVTMGQPQRCISVLTKTQASKAPSTSVTLSQARRQAFAVTMWWSKYTTHLRSLNSSQTPWVCRARWQGVLQAQETELHDYVGRAVTTRPAVILVHS